MFNGPKLIITYYFYLCIVVLVSWAEMFNLAGTMAVYLRCFRKTTEEKLLDALPTPLLLTNLSTITSYTDMFSFFYGHALKHHDSFCKTICQLVAMKKKWNLRRVLKQTVELTIVFCLDKKYGMYTTLFSFLLLLYKAQLSCVSNIFSTFNESLAVFKIR